MYRRVLQGNKQLIGDRFMFNNKIDVAKGFQTSINIAYDFNDIGKVSNFIPTLASLDIFEDVLLSTSPTATDRARILIGAYGRGKSHIVLVLLSLLYKSDKSAFNRLLDKMKEVNIKLYDYTVEYINSKQKLLPIVVSGSSSSLTQSFLYALQKALSNENIDNIMPDTHFKASIKTIDGWKSDYPNTYEKFVELIGEPIEEFMVSLKEYNVESYEKFISLFPILTSGSSFNPFLGFDVVELYEKVVDELCEIGYDGVYVVYDEFSKYLESSIGNATISDIKLLQDFAEKCNRSGKKQMHLMLICHKDISNYIDNNLPKEKVDGWRGVSGRFTHVTLHNNFSQMYEIISSVIQKDDSFWADFIVKNQDSFHELEKRYSNNGLIDSSNISAINSAIYGCYPLHPMSTFILPRLSEKVAQNERTLFTFLSSQEKHTLSTFLFEEHNSSFPLLTPDYIYDYFEPLFRKEVYTSEVYKIYKLASTVLKKLENNSLNSKIIKTIALIYMIEQFEKLPPIFDVVVDAFREHVKDTKTISNALEDLINKDCIVYLKRSNNYLKLKESSGIDTKQEIAKRIEVERATLCVKDILNSTSFDNYMYPIRYNDEHEIVRYFDFVFIDSKDFWATDDWNLTIDNSNADGAVFAIIPDSEEDIEKINNQMMLINDCNRAVFCVPKKYSDIENIAFEYHATKMLKSLVIDDDIIKDEYEIYIEDLEEVIFSFINKFTRPENASTDYFYEGKKIAIFRKAQMSALLSDICESIYQFAPTINNESINKNILPTVAINSRTKLVSALLNTNYTANLGLSGTGQEVSFMRSTLIQTGLIENISDAPTVNTEPADENIKYLIKTIQDFISDAGTVGEQSFNVLYNKLTRPEYGIGLKRGVIPIFIALIIHQNQNNLVIKKNNLEQKITAELLNAINENPDKFSIILENWNEEKALYLYKLEGIFKENIIQQEKVYNNFAYILYAMNRWYMSLPKYTKEMTKIYVGNGEFKPVLSNHRRFVNSLRQLNINPREFLFEKLFALYGFDEFSFNITDSVLKTKEEFDTAITMLLNVLIDDIKTIFIGNGSSCRVSLTSAVRDWYDSLKETTSQHLFANGENQILSLIKSVSNDEVAFVQQLAKLVTSLRIEDWNSDSIISFLNDLTAFKETVDEYNQQETNEALSADEYKLIVTDVDGNEVIKSFAKTDYSDRAKLLYNEISNSIEEMGQAISESEIRQVIIEILEKHC